MKQMQYNVKNIKTGQERWAILQILDCFQYPKKSLLKSNHPKSTCQISNPPKILELKISTPTPQKKKKSFDHPCHLKLWRTLLGVRGGAWQRTGEEGEVRAIRIQITFIDAEFV